MTGKDIPANRGLRTFFSAQASRFEPAIYVLLRIVFGAILFTHGLPKALGDSHGSMADPMASSIHFIRDAIGLPFAPQLAFLVMLLETVGSVMLILGVLTRVIALLFVVEMIGICVAMGPTWPWIDRGIEYPVFMGFLALYIFSRGAGRYSIDGKVSKHPRQPVGYSQ